MNDLKLNTQDLNIQEMNSYGRPGKHGNLLGIEPYMFPEDYLSAKTLLKKLDGYLEVAKKKGWLDERTIVIWPEYIGTFLAFNDEKPSDTLEGIVKNVIAAHQQEYEAFLATATEANKVYAAMFRTKAASMAEAYLSIFSHLSKRYTITTVAGSLVLPSPQFARGKIALDVNGLLYNVSAVFDPKGKPYPELVYKAYPTAGELPYTAAAPAGSLPIFDTPDGRLGVLICADSFYPMCYARLKTLKASLIAVPSFGHGGMEAWNATWKGYDGWPNPPDVDKNDVGKITNSEAWLKYSLATRIDESNADFGVNIFLHGNLWPDLVAGGGVAVVVHKGHKYHRESLTLAQP